MLFKLHLYVQTDSLVFALQAENDHDSSETAGNVKGVVIKIIRVFVDALPHVPEHRRLPILEQLISTLGGERFLWILLVLLFEQHVTKSVASVANGEKVKIMFERASI